MPSAREWTYGSEAERPRRTELRAGPLTMLLESCELLSIRLGDREVIRRIYAAVRDRNWGTVPAVFSEVREEIGVDSFRVTFRADHREREIHFTWTGTISGDPDGTVRYSLDGVARTTFLRNRIGFCVLHPDRSAGAHCRIVHGGGGSEEARLPEAISPHQPLLDLRAVAHEVEPGQWAELAFDGDVFEMEDQRNWTDASFKTYCTPLHLPYPVEIASGTRVAQSVTLRVPGARTVRRPSAAPPAYSIDRSAPRRPLPALGLGVASHGLPLSARELELLRAVHPSHLRVDVTPGDPGWEDGLRRAADQARSLGCALEVALLLSDAAREELGAVAGLAPTLGCELARWLIFHRGEAATTERWVSAARQLLPPACPGVAIAAGAKAYFTELNRGPRPGFADQVVFSVNPQIHAFDDGSLVETLRMQRLVVENAARLSGGRPIVVSPVTLRPRFNAVATGPVPPPEPGQLPDQVDARQMSLFGSAWTLGSLANLAASGAASLTYYETTGWRGLVELTSGPPAPHRFPPLPGCAFPLYHVLADAGEFRGGTLVAGESSAPLRLEGLTLEAGGRLRTLLANLTDRPAEVRVTGAPAVGWIRTLDLSSVERASRDPASFRGERGERGVSQAGALRLALAPLATTCIDWE
jgi:D-apionolactonase